MRSSTAVAIISCEDSTMSRIDDHLNGDRLSLIRLTTQRLQNLAIHEVHSQLSEKATLAIVDYLGAVATGLEAPWRPSLVQYARHRKNGSESYVWGLGTTASSETAAFVNAALAHR